MGLARARRGHSLFERFPLRTPSAGSTPGASRCYGLGPNDERAGPWRRVGHPLSSPLSNVATGVLTLDETHLRLECILALSPNYQVRNTHHTPPPWGACARVPLYERGGY